MAGGAQAGAVSGRRGVFEVDEDAALAELERAWADGGYHGFCVAGAQRVVRDQQLRRGAHGQHAGRAGPADPGALAGTAMSG